jgi:Copper type II ascorbate-dependent monooxygenase, C-terminal domain/Copper type II ascorbate-dependent monooxygenase, N-terminal domain
MVAGFRRGFGMRCVAMVSIGLLLFACGTKGGDDVADASSGEAGTTAGTLESTAADPTGSPTGPSTTASESGSGSASDPSTTSAVDSEGSSGDGTSGEEIEIWELRTDGYAPPLQETKYSCFSFTFPTEQLHHIVGITPMVTSPIVHHYVLSLADSEVALNPDNDCVEWPSHILWAWAPGIESIELPPEAGFLVGQQGPTVTFILQVHYNNPLMMPLSDDGGLDLHVTKQLRPNRAGVFTQGDILSIYVPGGDPAFEYVASCNGNMTAQLLPEPIHVFASFLHAHQLGSRLWTEVERDGAPAGEIARDDPFTFATQNFQPTDFDLMPGDALETHCVYDSSDKQGATMGGEGSDDEMCINFMMYWPWVPSEACGIL